MGGKPRKTLSDRLESLEEFVLKTHLEHTVWNVMLEDGCSREEAVQK